MSKLQNVSLRQKAVFIPQVAIQNEEKALSDRTALLVANLANLGYGVSEPLLRALNGTSPGFQAQLLATFREVMGVKKNWTPLVKAWDTPTGESYVDHIMTFFANVFQARGDRLQCGHIIPYGTFPLERYNGCPFCGTPFEAGEIEVMGQGSKMKVLDLWKESELNQFFADLLASKTALDATQMDSLKILLLELPFPSAKIAMKETLMAVIDLAIKNGQAEKVQTLFTSPTDILRYLWFKKTGFLQIVEPKTILRRTKSNNKSFNIFAPNKGSKEKLAKKLELKLKYGREDAKIVAKWLNDMPLEAEKMAEMMHAKRGMWVRFIRALRLAEYSKKKGFERLKELMDVFYNEIYEVWQGRVNHFRLRADADKTFALLKQRPGLFARSLFANMLWFGADETIAAFSEVIDKVPARLVFTLNMYAKNYFNKSQTRLVKPLGGVAKSISPNAMMNSYKNAELDAMCVQIEDLCLLAMEKRFAAIENENKTMFIDPYLFCMPVSIGDRSETVQDMPAALMGTRFPVEGNEVRLFMQWGTGLMAQHLDMDLSCHVAYEKTADSCSYSRLVTTGCKHSGDIRSIPNKIGTAEYINLNIKELQAAKAKFVTFTCNAYSSGALSPNLVVGWMDSKFPMKVSERTGVAYDPSCVQFQVRITQSAAKGLVFGVLDVEKAEIIWLEMPFAGQVVGGLNFKGVKALLDKLNSKLSVGNLLKIKAKAQGLEIVETAEEADEAYTQQWAANAAGVTALLVD